MSPSRLERFRLIFLAAFLPLSIVWAWVAALRARRSRKGYKARIPVVSVGNIHSGGTGKTPTVMALADALSARSPVIVSRGYGASAGKSGGWVDVGARDGALRFGDEPWMMATRGTVPVYVDGDRVRGLRAIEESDKKTGVVLLDDGFQHFRLARDVDLVVLPGRSGPAKAYCLPLGDLREPLSALERASAFLLIGQGSDWETWLGQRFPQTPQFRCEMRSDGVFWQGSPLSLEGRSFGAFCGVGDPENFRMTLSSYGSPVFFEAFSDHHPYSEKELSNLARRLGDVRPPLLVTTEKDWVRLTPSWQQRVATVRVRCIVPEACIRFIETQLEAG